MTPEDLLRKHNPLLVLLPQDPARHRPGSRWGQIVSAPRGDYHPCSAPLFLSLVVQRDRPKPWDPLEWREPTVEAPTGIDTIEARLQAQGAQAAAGWELDLAAIRSQDPDQAWQTLGVLLRERGGELAPRVYARFIAGARPVLEYWYLYLYNDAPNKHEGDWEMVMLELDENEQPVRAGYAGHAGGFQRPWSRVQKQGDRPLVYVARGSHAAYFEHRPEGHRTNSLSSSKGWPEPFESVWVRFNLLIQDTFTFLRLVDHTPSFPGGTADLGVGEIVDPALELFGDGPPSGDSDRPWWMDLRCRWGSSHSRLEGFIGPSPPWQQLTKWGNPRAWLDACVPD